MIRVNPLPLFSQNMNEIEPIDQFLFLFEIVTSFSKSPGTLVLTRWRPANIGVENMGYYAATNHLANEYSVKRKENTMEYYTIWKMSGNGVDMLGFAIHPSAVVCDASWK